MTDLTVEVIFRNVVIGAIPNDGTTTPIESFILNGFVYKITTNGDVYADSTTTGGNTFKYLVFNGTKFEYTNDVNGELYVNGTSSTASKNSFWMMIDDNNIIWVIGADLNGGLDPQYLQ